MIWKSPSRHWLKSTITFFMSIGITLLWPWGLLTRTACIEYTRTSRITWTIYHISVQNIMCQKEQVSGEACDTEHLCTAGKGDNCQVHFRSNAAYKEGSSTARYVNASILIETARNMSENWILGCDKSFLYHHLLEFQFNLLKNEKQ